MKSVKIVKLLLIVAITVLATIAFAAEAGTISLVPLAQALVIGIGLLATGLAQTAIGVAAIGAVAEDRRNFGTSLIFFLIPETLAIFGLAFSFMIG
jgi:V/A-type H+-transporting ATPase subunit K